MPSSGVVYPEWLARRATKRQHAVLREAPVSFSVLTTVYKGTVATLFLDAGESILRQKVERLEWIILAHGPVSRTLVSMLERLRGDARCHIEFLPDNLGPIRGLRYCLERASGDYIIPVDADDLLTPDALSVLATTIVANKRPAFVFSDEDHWVQDHPESPFIRWDFDPVLLTASSYIWHLCAFRRDLALELGTFTEGSAEWCHDWDTALRFHKAGLQLVHVPEVLYHWRRHSGSSTNRPNPESASLRSQRAVLERIKDLSGFPQLLEVREFPLFRGAPEWSIARNKNSPSVLDLVVWGDTPVRAAAAVCAALRSAEHPFNRVCLLGCRLLPGDRERVRRLLGIAADRMVEHPSRSLEDLRGFVSGTRADFIAFCSERAQIQSARWPWECDALLRLHPDVQIIGGRVLSRDRNVLAAAEVFGFDGVVGSPDAGMAEDEPGYFATALKPRSCSAPYSELFVARSSFVLETLPAFPMQASMDNLGLWMGAVASAMGMRVAYTPLLTAFGPSIDPSDRIRLAQPELDAFTFRFARLIPDLRCYPAAFRWTHAEAYALAEPHLESPRMG